ncbi:MAG TPA: hypothetical protein DCR40_15290 [Prolixibacteraceae bacterium]|nr:hypothetical protein [Prolixibacteraceae bacterium]
MTVIIMHRIKITFVFMMLKFKWLHEFDQCKVPANCVAEPISYVEKDLKFGDGILNFVATA